MKLPFPKFQEDNPEHIELSLLGRECPKLAANFVAETGIENPQDRELGVVRSRLKEQLSSEFERIDILVSKLSTGSKSEIHKESIKRRTRRPAKSGGLFD